MSRHALADTGWWRRDFAPLGVPTAIMADDRGLHEAACAPYADWVASHPGDAPKIEIRLQLASIAKTSGGIRVEGSSLFLGGPGIKGAADARTGRGWCHVSARLRDNQAQLASEAIEPILLFLLARMGRPPLHAAGIVLGDTALLLAGPSGSGKSTLALTAAMQGLPVLSDDTIHFQLEPRLRVWSFTHPIHVFPDEAPPGDHAIRVRAGKRKAAIPVHAARSCRHADHATLVLLARGDRLALDPIAREEAMAGLSRLDAGFDLLPRESAHIGEALIRRAAWKLTLTDDPSAAIALLRGRLGPSSC
jgi:hypothetical protein